MEKFKIGDKVQAGILRTGHLVEGELIEILEDDYAKVKSFKDGRIKNITLKRCTKLN